MPDATLILEGAAAAGGVAALLMLLLGVWPARRVAATATTMPLRRSRLASVAEVLAIAGGMGVGCWWLGIKPNTPPVEDKDRLLFVLLPAAGLVEILAVVWQRRPWIGRILRVLLALPLPFLMLFGSGWLPANWTPGGDPAAPSTWTDHEALRNVLGLGILLSVIWNLLVWAAQRAGGMVVPAALGLISAAAGVTIMLSGYATAGMIGLPFAGVAAGALLVCLLFARAHSMTGVAGVVTVLLFGLLIAGKFFGELATTNFALLIAAPPVLCGLLALPPLQKLKTAQRFVVVLVACLVPAGVAVGLAQHSFAAATDESSAYGSASSGSDAPAFNGTSAGSADPSRTNEPAPSRSKSSTGLPGDPQTDEEPKRSAPIDPAESKN